MINEKDTLMVLGFEFDTEHGSIQESNNSYFLFALCREM